MKKGNLDKSEDTNSASPTTANHDPEKCQIPFCRDCLDLIKRVVKRADSLLASAVEAEPEQPTAPNFSTYAVSERDFEHFIAEWLNSENSKYSQFVEGVKLFRQYLDERIEHNAPDSEAKSNSQEFAPKSANHIESLRHGYSTATSGQSEPSNFQIVEKINEIIAYLNQPTPTKGIATMAGDFIGAGETIPYKTIKGTDYVELDWLSRRLNQPAEHNEPDPEAKSYPASMPTLDEILVSYKRSGFVTGSKLDNKILAEHVKQLTALFISEMKKLLPAKKYPQTKGDPHFVEPIVAKTINSPSTFEPIRNEGFNRALTEIEEALEQYGKG